MILADRLAAITPEGDLLGRLTYGNAQAAARFEADFAAGIPARSEISVATWVADSRGGREG